MSENPLSVLELEKESIVGMYLLSEVYEVYEVYGMGFWPLPGFLFSFSSTFSSTSSLEGACLTSSDSFNGSRILLVFH